MRATAELTFAKTVVKHLRFCVSEVLHVRFGG